MILNVEKQGQDDDRCLEWWQQIENRRVELSGNLFTSSEGWNAFNAEVDEYNRQCGSGSLTVYL